MDSSFAASLARLLLVLAALLAGASGARAQAADADHVQTAWRLLDYIAVDYAGAVAKGAVTSRSEYDEQREFAATVAARLRGLPAKPGRERLLADTAQLQQAIDAKAEPAVVADMAHAVAAALLAAYPVPLAPSRPPTLARGAALYAQNCASCHGAAGDGRGPAAAALAEPPIAFTDRERAGQRSIFALYQVVTQGLDGTAMPSFGALSPDDRWALAFFAGHFAFDAKQAADGERLWRTDAALRQAVPDLKTLVGLTPAALEAKVGAQPAQALMAHLRRHPDAVVPPSAATLAVVRDRLAQSVAAVRAGRAQQARDLALSAYLDGFEPVEPLLGSRDATLVGRIEGEMGAYRAAVERDADAADLDRRVQVIATLLDDAEAALAPKAASGLSTFVGAATILLREGLEALLVVVAMIAFLRKAERPEALPYVHGGWVGALVAGVATWAIAAWVVGISGASRELTEGFGSLFAAAVLLSVGIWMHGKSHADQWQRYIRAKMSKALSGRSAWLLAGLAFIVVYREVFETILFYAALWTDGNGLAMVAGAATSCVALAVIAAAMLGYSKRLPIGKFFGYSAWLMAVLTVVLAGKGVSALQEAGIVGIAPLAGWPRLSMAGVFPTVQTVGVQLLVVAALVLGFRWNLRQDGGTAAASR